MKEIEGIIPEATRLTFLIRIAENQKIDDAAIIIGNGLLDIEKGNFRIVDISPYFDCLFVSSLIIKLDILILKPFDPDDLSRLISEKLNEIRSKKNGPITYLYCPPLTRILK